MERHNHDDDPPRQPPPPDTANVFDDAFELDDEDDFMPVSDGFRPSRLSGGWNGGGAGQDHDRDRNRDDRPPLATPTPADAADLRRMASRNSTMKTHFPRRESTSQDARNPPTHARNLSAQAAALQHRMSVSSTASFATMAPADSPLPAGPSHPYGMYPQHTMARSLSVTTTATQGQPLQPISLQGPTHPYNLYPQNVVEDPEETPLPPQSHIPVGFPGLNTGYHRQIGPDGEEQDIVGPDGHTEQLPPYSRYPEEGPTKAALAAEASSTPVEPTPPSPLSPPSPHSPPSPRPRSPSIDDEISPLAPLLSLAAPSEAHRHSRYQEVQDPIPPSSRSSSNLENSILEKESFISNRKRKWHNRRLCGKIPYVVVAILIILVLIFAIVLGAAIGTFVAKNNKNNDKGGGGGGGKDDNKNHEADPSPQVTGPGSLFDASPIPTDAALPPLPTGSFALPLGIAQESSPACLMQANQLNAWSCKMTFAPLVLNINLFNASVSPSTPQPNQGILYGVQPPNIMNAPLQLVTDMDYKAFGPAFHFQTMYDKLVVLSSNEFAAGANIRKRQEKPPPNFRHRFQVQPGDTPWYCFWNQTFLEGYIYVTDESSAASMTAFPSAWPTAFPSVVSEPSETPGPTPSSPLSSSFSSPLSSPLSASPSPTPVAKRQSENELRRLPPYPRIVKVEERRLPGTTEPYCQKMRLLDNGALIPALDSDGNEITIFLQEDDPSYEEFYEAVPTQTSADPSPTSNGTARLEKRRDPPGACHCQWMFQ
ncbi:hypothetical protein P154DRAFT_215597 [Amniculicola lignicola CBS 123094]|uniref:DUF7820 domain-containing protein n=1 Tax=Amniculicola lignicola CBS 123094 TaxID=1392246 RepID=A0A6A5WKF6_9PLEO|nr:hypothetical protein P154DRAFT_215597 [Amniculicola lignicola CBS 123094]